ncbi:beta-galactosidase-like protein [Lentzea atacamensis]|uniref:beta-galactosidase n=1 Tax=Lentzea atacamensis TaxID=531938 RepID=A0ABX9EI48_9PSEU|nr:beta galactosidase jelly roll domain-containing protein [Lentzea atacamensis]RAS70851.1 beta-galactosidase-like protein [Lentzea atacamensis]
MRTPRILLALLVVLGVSVVPAVAAERHQVGYDRYSLTVDGKRVLLWPGEFHYFRLPSPELWRDVLQRSEKTVSVNAITGRRGNYLVWLNGQYLGSAAGGTEADAEPVNPDPGRGDFAIPDGLLKPGSTATLSVLVTNMGHNDNWTADDVRFKQPRGLFGVTVGDAKISWQIRGSRYDDVERGPLNTGGLYGELAGWHLPGGDGPWSEAPAAMPAGVSWYRSTFRLDLPENQDVPVALRFGEQPDRKYRAFVFVNGWNAGHYMTGAPQRDFVVPAGVLRKKNAVVLAVVATEPGELAPVSLVALGNHRTSGHLR